MKVIELQGIDNVRDLGGTPLAGSRVLKPGLIYRGSALFGATESDLELLFGTLGISCVIDVRCGWEREAKPDAPMPGVENHHIPFYDLEIVGIEYTEPAAGTKRIGRDVACEPPLFYRSLANELTVRQMRKGIDTVFAHATSKRPVYLHCSGGKDRAGILTLLVLIILGADRDTILEDYLYTNVSRDKNYDKMFQRFYRLADGDEARAHELVISHRALPENLDTFYKAINERYGNMESFVRKQLGISDEQRMRIQDACTI